MYLILEHHDFVDTIFKFLYQNEQVKIRIRPWLINTLATKVTIQDQDYLIKGKNYRDGLKESPVSFRHKICNWDLELGYSGDPYRGGKYSLKINGKSLEDLPKVPVR